MPEVNHELQKSDVMFLKTLKHKIDLSLKYDDPL